MISLSWPLSLLLFRHHLIEPFCYNTYWRYILVIIIPKRPVPVLRVKAGKDLTFKSFVVVCFFVEKRTPTSVNKIYIIRRKSFSLMYMGIT